jgi:hypothetical protein
MLKKPFNILAINPGTRYLGIAFFNDTELREWGIKVIKGKKTEGLLLELINRFSINVVTLKKLHPSRTSPALRTLVSSIGQIAKGHNLPLYDFSIGEIKEELLTPDQKNKTALMQEVALRHPFLFQEMQREEKNRNPYLIRMFEAIALGIVCFNRLDVGR